MKLPSILEQAEERGIARGRDEGIALGTERGIARGRDEGIALGRREALRIVMERLIEGGMAPAEAAKSIGLS